MGYSDTFIKPSKKKFNLLWWIYVGSEWRIFDWIIFTCQNVQKGHQELSKVSKLAKKDIYYTFIFTGNQRNLCFVIHKGWIRVKNVGLDPRSVQKGAIVCQILHMGLFLKTVVLKPKICKNRQNLHFWRENRCLYIFCYLLYH